MLANDAASTSPHITGTATARNGSRFHTSLLRKRITISFQIRSWRSTEPSKTPWTAAGCRLEKQEKGRIDRRRQNGADR
jgi:hypothetical protein